MKRYIISLFCLAHSIWLCESQFGEKEKYQGKPLGKLNSYHHQVNGEVYAVDEYTLLIRNFVYDGNGLDTYFWAGSSIRPGPQGFIVPDDKGKTNVLSHYLNKDFTLTLPDRKKVTDIRWLSVYDITTQENFGDISIPEGFEPPATQRLSELSRRSHGVRSDSLKVLDARTILVPDLFYDGLGTTTYFWVGVGPQPGVKGTKVPDEKGYLGPLRAYDGENVMLTLPGELTVADVDWFSIFNVETGENFGSVIIPSDLNVPPSLLRVIPHTSNLPNCEQLHRDVQVSWEIFGPQITIEIASLIGDNEYVGFGLSGLYGESVMEGADVALLYMEGFQGYAVDYNITAKSTCVSVLGAYRGVCRDDVLGGTDSFQFHSVMRKDGLTVFTYRRSLMPPEPGDKPYPTEGKTSIIWSVGRLDAKGRPAFHRLWTRHHTALEFGRKEEKNCHAFTEVAEKLTPWEPVVIQDQFLRSYRMQLGPPGGKRGYEAITGQPGNDLVWYVNGFLAPEIYLRRDLAYTFIVEGGNDPHSANLYHPFIITDEPLGGYEQLNEADRKNVRILAGIEYIRRGTRPTTVGRFCGWLHGDRDRRMDEDFPTFQKFRNSLQFKCNEGDQGVLEVHPNSSWPDVVYYHSYTHSNMGWKINVVDRFGSPKTSGTSSWTVSVFYLIVPLILSFSY